jgi:hypothetical protein
MLEPRDYLPSSVFGQWAPPSACLDSWWLSGRHLLLGSIQDLWYVPKAILIERQIN